MRKCTGCGGDINDFEELKFGLCWECMAKDDKIINDNPKIGEIKEDEEYSLCIISSDGSNVKFAVSNKSKIEDDKKSSKKGKNTTTKKVSDNGSDPGNEGDTGSEGNTGNKGDTGNKGETGNNKKPKATTEPSKKGAKIPVDEDEQRVIRESKEIFTTASRAKTRAFALINEALKNTAQFDVTGIVDGKRMTVGSIPRDEKDIENIVMSTTMEVMDTEINNKKKKR